METAQQIPPANLADVVNVLDHGFVRLVDHMGGDSRIVEAARVSYASNSKPTTPEGDARLINYLLKNRHCYDGETEVLTDAGFVPWPALFEESVKQGGGIGPGRAASFLTLAVFDPLANVIRYESPEYLTKDAYEGRMYRVEHGGVDLLVTPDHSMLVRQRQKGGFSGAFGLTKASALGHRSMVQYKKAAPLQENPTVVEHHLSQFPPHDDPAALLELCGFFVGDGSLTSAHRIGFHLKKRRKIEYLSELVVRLGWEMRVLANDNYSVVVPDAGSHQRFGQFYACEDKAIPHWFLMMGGRWNRSFLIGLRNSDGSEKRGTWVYTTSVEHVAKQVQILALHAGQAAHVCKNAAGMWTVSMLSRMQRPIINQSRQNTSDVEGWSGDVFCAKTSTGVLVVRRNGKIVLSGNTSPFEQVVLTFHCKMPIFVARQWVRHRTARLNEVSGRYTELPEEYYVPEVANILKQSKNNKQGREGELTEGIAELFAEDCRRAGELDFRQYKRALDADVAKELARINLPLSTYTEWYWQIDLHNLFHFLGLRLDSHAQYEIRVYAEALYGFAKLVAPVACQAFEEHVLHAKTFSRSEVALLLSAANASDYNFSLTDAIWDKLGRDK